VFRKKAKERNTRHPFSAASVSNLGRLLTLLPTHSHPDSEVCQLPSGVLRGPTRPPRSCIPEPNPGADFSELFRARLKQHPGRSPTSRPTCISQSLPLSACPVFCTKPVASRQRRQMKAATTPGNGWHF